MSDKSAESDPGELPGSVSNQNSEEAEPGHGGGPEKGRPSSDDKTETRGGESGQGGESSEGSQSTGDPNSAG